MGNILSFKDIESMTDSISGKKLLRESLNNRMSTGIKGTRIRIKDLSTGEVQEVHNKVVISGSIICAARIFDIEAPAVPTYNEALELDNSVYGETPINVPKVCLFGIADDGCGTLDSDVYVPAYVDRIAPQNLFPFRYIIPSKTDLNADERKIYYGRKEDEEGNISYYFKAFNNEPQIFLRYTDGTEINPATMYNVITDQEAECYVQLDLLINRLDFREYFENVIGWDKARISSMSLLYGWYTTDGGFKYYQDIIPFTKLNFSYEKLVDSTKALSFEYSLFF